MRLGSLRVARLILLFGSVVASLLAAEYHPWVAFELPGDESTRQSSMACVQSVASHEAVMGTTLPIFWVASESPVDDNDDDLILSVVSSVRVAFELPFAFGRTVITLYKFSPDMCVEVNSGFFAFVQSIARSHVYLSWKQLCLGSRYVCCLCAPSSALRTCWCDSLLMYS